MPPKLFSFTLLSKNAPANHLVSHSCKNKGLKVSCFHTLTKKRVGEGGRISCFDFRVSSPNFRLSTLDCQLSRVSPLDSALTFFLSANPLASTLTGFTLVKSFTSNTYEKHTRGEGGLARPPLPHSRPLPPPITQSRLTAHDRCTRVPIPVGTGDFGSFRLVDCRLSTASTVLDSRKPHDPI